MATTHIGEGDKASWGWHGLHQSSAHASSAHPGPSDINSGGFGGVASQLGNVAKVGGQSGPSVPIHQGPAVPPQPNPAVSTLQAPTAPAAPAAPAASIQQNSAAPAPQPSAGLASQGPSAPTALPTQQAPAVHTLPAQPVFKPQAGSEAVKPVSVPEAAPKEKLNGDASALDKEQKPKQEEPRSEVKEVNKSDEVAKPAENQEAQVGDKRKADEPAVPKVTAGIEDQEAKKLKTAEAAPPSDASKNEADTAKPTEKKKPRAPKKEKKVPRTGTAARQTRSQGAAPVTGL